jgi:hypothetical protein
MGGTELASPTTLKWETKDMWLLPGKPDERRPGGFSECLTLFLETVFSLRQHDVVVEQIVARNIY